MEKQIENRWELREVGCGGGDQLKTGSRSLKTRLYRGGWGLQEGGAGVRGCRVWTSRSGVASVGIEGGCESAGVWVFCSEREREIH